MTLLEKAIVYREENPEKWKSRQKENDIRVNESYGIFEDNSFLSDYYQRMDAIHEEEEKLEEQRKHEPPTLSIALEFNTPTTLTTDKTKATNTYASLPVNGISVRDKKEKFLNNFKNRNKEERGKESELLIKVTQGKNLNNVFGEQGTKLKECRLKCKVCPGYEKQGSKAKTKYVYCNIKGTTTWNHVFVLKGYSSSELADNHVILEVVGKCCDGKVLIGETILAGKNASISETDTTLKFAPTHEQYQHWQKAIDKPGSVVIADVGLDTDQCIDSNENYFKEIFRQELIGKSEKTKKRGPFEIFKGCC